ncbi:MAG: hypothetical protein LBV30_04675 [Propionibacteriaceae bacterium]|jgi:hypothetical protein|nr:hypothetical protein [Propionibacteriaceae bacterium]
MLLVGRHLRAIAARRRIWISLLTVPLLVWLILSLSWREQLASWLQGIDASLGAAAWALADDSIFAAVICTSSWINSLLLLLVWRDDRQSGRMDRFQSGTLSSAGLVGSYLLAGGLVIWLCQLLTLMIVAGARATICQTTISWMGLLIAVIISALLAATLAATSLLAASRLTSLGGLAIYAVIGWLALGLSTLGPIPTTATAAGFLPFGAVSVIWRQSADADLLASGLGPLGDLSAWSIAGHNCPVWVSWLILIVWLAVATVMALTMPRRTTQPGQSANQPFFL